MEVWTISFCCICCQIANLVSHQDNTEHLHPKSSDFYQSKTWIKVWNLFQACWILLLPFFLPHHLFTHKPVHPIWHFHPPVFPFPFFCWLSHKSVPNQSEDGINLAHDFWHLQIEYTRVPSPLSIWLHQSSPPQSGKCVCVCLCLRALKKKRVEFGSQ